MLWRLNHVIILFSVVYFTTIIVFYSLLQKQHNLKDTSSRGQETLSKVNDVTCLILEFENFDNNLFDTVNEACQVFSSVIIYSETIIYPPILFRNKSNCHVTVIEKGKIGARNTYPSYNWLSLIKSKYLIVLPDSTRIVKQYSNDKLSTYIIQTLLNSNVDGLLFPVYSQSTNSFDRNEWENIYFDLKRWTLNLPNLFDLVDLINLDDFVLFVKTSHILKLPFPFLRPFVLSFIIQSQIANVKLDLFDQKIFLKESGLFLTDRSKEKHGQYFNYRLTQLYTDLGIKKVIYWNGSIEWRGCDRSKPRCFGTIVDNVPEYLVRDRWLPPCCRHNLEVTGRYVLKLLQQLGIRYWLEGGTLLGAARNGQIIDWDYDIDLGIYREDSNKFNILSKLLESDAGYQIEDGQGFVWQRALEGDFIKVHYSAINRIHVDLFPFISVNGTMTKDTWFADHPQDVPFPEHFLIPMTKVQFIGLEVFAPNHIRQFLELKFGEGAIETPRYPTNQIVL